ncbi:MAG TPA: bifunctional hydroxymethylpyrimidine kinase/phosphomethylpyrimidine kinase [Solirubrobacteraceae bacterium]|nr:bifunctional hydroxymethylpyrimidine kinase/phosphomethylpyrimidine kinase [Solirubrobacteraceae bacterium]
MSIAGSDSGGGAGIQADLKAFAACGVHGMTAITAITAQNTVAVSSVHHVPAPVIEAQVRAVSEDIGLDAVKIGMLGTVATIHAVCRALERHATNVPVVLDPVMVSESGSALLEPEAREALVRELLPRVTVTTPNLPEAAAIVGGDAAAIVGGDAAAVVSGEARTGAGHRQDPRWLAREIGRLGVGAVIVTGGHREVATDVLFDGHEIVELEGPRHPGGSAHGSGCTHSSVLAARLAHGDSLIVAARFARRVAGLAVRDGLDSIGAGPGPVDVIGVRSPRFS